MINEILLRRKNIIALEVDDLLNTDVSGDYTRLSGFDSAINLIYRDRYVLTIMKDVEQLGYTFSKNLYKMLCEVSHGDLTTIYLDLVRMLKNMVGDDVKYEPMYPNFPSSVMNRSDAELYMNAIVHYWSNGTLYPVEKEDARLPLFDSIKVKVLDVGCIDDLQLIFSNLCSSKTSLSQQDKEDMIWIFRNRDMIPSFKFPEDIPLKENVAIIGKLYIENLANALAKDIQKYFKTATDVLRLVTAMSDGDVSLANNTKFRNIRRAERRIIMDLLNGCGDIEEDMLRNKGRWVRIGEKIHPGEYDYNKYKKVIVAFDKIRNNIKIETFNGKMDAACKRGDFESALKIAATRPGELARRLDYFLRKNKNGKSVINFFKDVSKNVSTPVLLQVRQHFISRGDDMDVRVFFPKGNLARSWAMDNNLEPIEEKYCKAIVQICENALVEQYSKREFLGNVYLSEAYKNYIVPFSQRSASKSLKTIVRGSRIPIDENTKYIRAFIWWTNTKYGRVDLDLSASFFDENWNYKVHISYTNLRNRHMDAVHSGDIVNGGRVDGVGVSEFLDVNINDMTRLNIRYIVFQVHGYFCPGFNQMEHAMFGWMNREGVMSGEIYEPKTVEQKMSLASESKVCIPVIFDCVAREFIWCDMNISMDGTCYSRGGNNVESNIRGVVATCYAMVNMSKPSLYDLISLHIRARGVPVGNKDDADIVFDLDDGITPYDTDVFMGEYI